MLDIDFKTMTLKDRIQWFITIEERGNLLGKFPCRVNVTSSWLKDGGWIRLTFCFNKHSRLAEMACQTLYAGPGPLEVLECLLTAVDDQAGNMAKWRLEGTWATDARFDCSSETMEVSFRFRKCRLETCR